MQVVIFGATGMVGTGVLLECLADPRVTSVLTVGRSATKREHPKLTEFVLKNFGELADLHDELVSCDACFYCLGVTSVGLSEEEYTLLTYDLTMAAAAVLKKAYKGMTFIFVSGEGTDSTGTSRQMWARVKGRAENALLSFGFKRAFMFRPGFIQPLNSIRSKTRWYNYLYRLTGELYPFLIDLAPNYVSTTANIGKAMIEVALNGYDKPILRSADFNKLAVIPPPTVAVVIGDDHSLASGDSIA